MKTWNARKGENHGELTRQLASVWIAGDEGFAIAQQMANAPILADELHTSRLAFSGALLEISTLKRQRDELIEALQDIVNAANDNEQNEYHVKKARTALERCRC